MKYNDANDAPVIQVRKYIHNRSNSPDTKFGPRVLAGFILAPVNLPKMKARMVTLRPTKLETANLLSVFEIITRIDDISKNVIDISIIEANPIDIPSARTVGPIGPIRTAAKIPPSNWATMYGITAFLSKSPCIQKAIVTAELMWAPEIGAKIRIARVTANPKAIEIRSEESVNAIEPQPIPTMRAVPRNSASALFHMAPLRKLVVFIFPLDSFA